MTVLMDFDFPLTLSSKMSMSMPMSIFQISKSQCQCQCQFSRDSQNQCQCQCQYLQKSQCQWVFFLYGHSTWSQMVLLYWNLQMVISRPSFIVGFNQKVISTTYGLDYNRSQMDSEDSIFARNRASIHM